MTIRMQKYALMIAERLRDHATRQGNVPFDKGDLRKSHVVEPHGRDGAILSANTPYARAVHDGRPAITIKPKRKKALKFKGGFAKSAKQPARKGNPWLARAVADLEREGAGFLAHELGKEVADELTRALKARGLKVRRR